jgi:hypothetical protein
MSLDIEKITPKFCWWAFGAPYIEFTLDFLEKWNILHDHKLAVYPPNVMNDSVAKMIEIYEEEQKKYAF